MVIPNSATSIGADVFNGCTSLTGITIPDNVTSIGADVFNGCTSLIGITIPDNITSIGERAFMDCTSLTSVTIGKGVTSIGADTFNGCTSLTGITIPDNITSINGRAFIDCTSLTSVTIGKGVTNIGLNAFNGCTGLMDVYITDPIAWCKIDFAGTWGNPLYYAERGHLLNAEGEEITQLVLDDSVTAIPDYAFSGCAQLTDIVISDNVTSIGERAFYNCTSLTGVTIGNGITYIRDYAFFGCSSLTGITIPDNVTSIGERAFYNCTSLTSVTIGNGITHIRDYAFFGCGSLTSIIIPDNVTSIGERAFYNCTNLTSITIPDSVTSIGSLAFSSCPIKKLIVSEGSISVTSEMVIRESTLEEVVIPNSVTSIGDSAFYYCTSLTSITLPDSVISIGERAFYHCENLTSITIPNSVISIGNSAFIYCSKLTRVVYCGTQEQWESIHVGSGNSALMEATLNLHCDLNGTCTICGSKIAYIITFQNWNNTILSTQAYHYGDPVIAPANPTKAADNTYTYTFAGWDKPVVNCAGDVTYTATYKAAYIDYVVKFLNEDGTVLSTKTYHWGDVVTALSNPTKAADRTYTYAFAGWDKTVVNCAGNATYKATYNATYINYTVFFKNWDGTVLSSKTYHYGDAVSEPGAPTRPNDDKYAYTFVGWDKAVVNCAGDATYTAVYSAVSLVPNTITSSTHTVRDGIISKITVGTITDQLINALNEKSYAKVFSGTTEVPGSALVGTGMEVRIMDGDTVTVSATAVVTGDINGDGKITVTDFVQMKAHLLKKSTLQGASAHAADTSGDGNISVTDFVQMKAHLLGKNPVQPQSVPATTPVSAALSVSQNDASEQDPVAAVSYTHIVALVPDKKTLITV